MITTNKRITSIVTRVALLVALAVMLALPLGYWLIAYNDFRADLGFKAKVKATAVAGLVATNPDVWMYAENRLFGLLTREPVPLETELVEVYDDHGELLAQVGETPQNPVLRRSYNVFDGTRIAGRVTVSDSLRGMIYGTAAAFAVGLVLGGTIFVVLRTLPLRALRRVTDALFDQKQRAEVTLQSIGDAVITTDAQMRVEFFNPVAEQVSGWSLSEAKGRPITDILHLIDAASERPIPTTLEQALADNRIVSFGRDATLIKRDGSSIGIDDSAAPIVDANGRITGGVMIFRDVSAARELARRRSWEAAHDVLTGLVNRREFETLVDGAVDSARNRSKHHVVCYLDLDQFKAVNDACGHAAGDQLLKEIAELLQSRIRVSDTLARLGGDEFGLLLPGCSLERAQFIASDLLAAVGDFRFHWEAKVYTVGVSIGLATIAGDSVSRDEVMSMADTACYWAKEQGRHRVCAYRAGDSDMAARRRETSWIARINSALEEDRFVLYHQDYLPLSTGAGTREHLEVLLRMLDENGNLIQPGSFLPAAERYNLMPAIDRWVVSKVFAGYRTLVAERGGAPLTCAINLSGSSINAAGFFDFVLAKAVEHALPPNAICFEITETAAINNLRNAAEFIRQCKSSGMLFALDDFGTGTSSFGYLKTLPVDYLKIDGGFVQNLAHDAMDRAMTDTINRIGHIMGIKTVAEYAETATIIQELKAIGVDYAQGFGVCLPTPLFGSPTLPRAASRSREEAISVLAA